jgi:hypothetical protein
MALTQQEKEARARKAAERFNNETATPRPGLSAGGSAAPPKRVALKGVELSEIVWLDPAALKPNTKNPYPPLDDEELDELAASIAQDGVLVPLILKGDRTTLLCGHNRRTATLRARKLPAELIRADLGRVPAQTVISPLAPDDELRVMKMENDLRRGGRWTKAKKEQFIETHFAEELTQDHRGGDRRSAARNAKPQPTASLPERIAQASRGRIGKAEAKKHVANLRKKTASKKKPEKSRHAPLPPEKKKAGAKIVAELKTLDKSISGLERQLKQARTTRDKKLAALRRIAPPRLFGL